jgi:hypothetical protein
METRKSERVWRRTRADEPITEPIKSRYTTNKGRLYAVILMRCLHVYQLLLFADDSLDCTAFFAEDYRHQSIAYRIVNEHERSNACTTLETRRLSFHSATPYPHITFAYFYKHAEKSHFLSEVEIQ